MLYVEGKVAIDVKRRINLRSFRMTQVTFFSLLWVVATTKIGAVVR